MKVNNSFILNALRNCGYTTYSAIADIIDNSIEQDVRVTKKCTPFVKIVTFSDKPNSQINRILICDNGCGMNSEILQEAMNLGSNTGKNPTEDLGCYGTGLKAASFSIGQTLEVYTKEANSDNVLYASVSLKKSLFTGNNVEVEFETYNKDTDIYKFFSSYIECDKANLLHGTIISISDIDRISDNNDQFSGRLKYEIADIFNQFIKNNVVNFYINQNKVLYTNFVDSGIEMANATTDVKGIEVTYKCYDLKNADYHIRASKNENTHGHYLIDNNSDHYIVNTNAYTSGIYIYRQNRLVGKALKFNVVGNGDGYTQRFRCELFIDGNADSLFSTSFNKMISEKESQSMCEEMRSFLDKNIKPYADEISKKAHRLNRELKINDPEEIKTLNRVALTANKNNLLTIDRTNGINEKQNIVNKTIHNKRGPQQNPNPTRLRHDKWFKGFEIIDLGKGENYYIISRSEEKGRKLYSVQINSSHKFYTEFFNKLDDNFKFLYGQILVCETLARENLNYWGDDNNKELFDQYDAFLTTELCKVL